MNSTFIGISAALISTMAWATCSLIFKKLGERLEPIGMTLVKTVLSSIILAIIVLLSSSGFALAMGDVLAVALSGILGIAIGDSLFFASLNRLSPIVLAIILFVGPDLFSGIFGLLFLNELPSIISWLGIAFILIGLAFLMFPIEKDERGDVHRTQFIGIIFALLSLICTAYSMVIVKPVLAVSSTLTVTMYRMLFGGIFLIVYAFVSKKIFFWMDILKDKKYFVKLSGTIGIATVGGFWLSLLAIKNIKLIIASSLMTLEPLFILVFMILFYKYIPKKKELIGIFFAIIGILALCVG